MITRYDIDIDGLRYEYHEGDYVLIEDHEKIVKEFEEKISDLNEYVEKLEKTLRDNEIGIPY